MQKILLLSIAITLINCAKAQDPYITSPGEYGQTYMSYQLSENIFYSGTSRYRITSTVDGNNVSMLVNGKYGETAVTVPAAQSATITVDFQAKGSGYIQSPGGYLYLNFYDTYYPDSITATIYDSSGNDDGIAWDDWSNVSTTSPYLLFRAHIPDWMTNLKKIEIRIKSRTGVATKVSELEYVLEQTGQYESGLVTKWGNNTTWSDLVIKDTGNVQRAFIKNTGFAYLQKLGIGTVNTNDTAKLFVEGQIRARQVKVDQDSWPDYVFSKKYKLPSLPALKKFINENNHLPNVPSAHEVQLKGLDVGQSQAALLQKVEELTLYLIKQNEEIQKLQRKLQQLSKSVSKLR